MNSYAGHWRTPRGASAARCLSLPACSRCACATKFHLQWLIGLRRPSSRPESIRPMVLMNRSRGTPPEANSPPHRCGGRFPTPQAESKLQLVVDPAEGIGHGRTPNENQRIGRGIRRRSFDVVGAQSHRRRWFGPVALLGLSGARSSDHHHLGAAMAGGWESTGGRKGVDVLRWASTPGCDRITARTRITYSPSRARSSGSPYPCRADLLEAEAQ